MRTVLQRPISRNTDYIRQLARTMLGLSPIRRCCVLNASVPAARPRDKTRSPMAHVNKVLKSINEAGAGRCVDIFRRPDGSIGFEEFRRDVEDTRGWFPIGGHANRLFADETAALEAALAAVPWLRQAFPAGGR
eukprot:gene22706-23943_t